jgi:pimeloyl-[acyl-carrier protein] synthase
MGGESTALTTAEAQVPPLSLYHLLDPEVLANPYPLFHRLRSEDPVHWDPYLHAWVVTRYADVVTVLHDFSAERTPSPELLASMGLEDLAPIAKVMVKQMLFLDPPTHTRIRGLASYAFTPQRVAVLRDHIRDIVKRLLDAAEPKGRMDVIADLAEPLPYIITAEMLGVPTEDAPQLKAWSQDFAEMLGNFQHNPEHAPKVRRAVDEMTKYFESAIREIRKNPCEGLIHSFLTAEVDGDRFTDEEVVANTIVTMVGGQETTTNLIGNGVLTLLRNPEALALLQSDLSLIPSAVEEMLRYEPPSQHTARLAPSDYDLGGKQIRKRQAVIAVMAAGNRDPERFPNPDSFDITRKENRHLSFGWAAHFCFGAALARIESQVAFEMFLRRFSNLSLDPKPLVWRTNLGLRGLTSLPVTLGEAKGADPSSDQIAAATSDLRKKQMVSTEVISGASRLSETKRKLLEKYLRSETFPRPSKSFAIPRRPPDTVAPLAVAQEQVWLRAQKLQGMPALYNECITIHRNGPLNIHALECSLAEIIRRHEIWRTSYDVKDGRPVQTVHPAPKTFNLPVVDLRRLPCGERETEAIRLASEHSRAPFDLQRGPLLRAFLLQMEDRQFRLHLTMHQSVVDGVSVYRIFPEELTTLYESFSSGKPSPLPDLPVQYADYSCWQRGWLQGEILNRQMAYWRKQLGGDLSVLDWPNDYARPATQTYRGEIVPFAWSKRLTEALRAFSHQEGVTLFSILLAGFTSLLHHYTGQDDIVVGTLSPSGRKRSEVQRLIGYFLNPVALRTRLSGNPTFRDLLRQAREVVSEALSNDDVPLEWLADELKLKPDALRHPFFQSVISLGSDLAQLPAGWDQTYMDVGSGGARWDLYLEFSDRPEGMIGRAQFNPDLFEPATVQRMLQNLENLLEVATTNPQLLVSKLPVGRASRTCAVTTKAGKL